MDKHLFSSQELASSENLIKWNQVSSSLFIQAGWFLDCININYLDPHYLYTSPKFVAGDDGNIKFNLASRIIRYEHRDKFVKLRVAFDCEDAIECLFWNGFAIDDGLKSFHSINCKRLERNHELNITWETGNSFSRKDVKILLVAEMLLHVKRSLRIQRPLRAKFNVEELQLRLTNSKSKIICDWKVIDSPVNITYKWVVSLDDLTKYDNLSSPWITDSDLEKRKWKLTIDKTYAFTNINLHLGLVEPEDEVEFYGWEAFMLDKNMQIRNFFQSFGRVYKSSDFKYNEMTDLYIPPSDYVLAQNSICIIAHIVATYKSTYSLKEEVLEAASTSVSEPPKAKKHKPIVIEENNHIDNHVGDQRLKLFNKLLFNEEFSDIRLVVNDQDIPAHKNILSVYSTVFYEHFIENEDMTHLEIREISHDTVTAMLRYIYTGEFDDSDFQNLLNLLEAASRYNIEGLKDRVEQYLGNTITVDNVAQITVVAETYDAENLRESALKFITENQKAIKPADYETICEVNPKLLIKILASPSSQN